MFARGEGNFASKIKMLFSFVFLVVGNSVLESSYTWPWIRSYLNLSKWRLGWKVKKKLDLYAEKWVPQCRILKQPVLNLSVLHLSVPLCLFWVVHYISRLKWCISVTQFLKYTRLKGSKTSSHLCTPLSNCLYNIPHSTHTGA